MFIEGNVLYAVVNGISLHSTVANFALTLAYIYVGYCVITIGAVPWVFRYLTLCR